MFTLEIKHNFPDWPITTKTDNEETAKRIFRECLSDSQVQSISVIWDQGTLSWNRARGADNKAMPSMDVIGLFGGYREWANLGAMGAII